MWTKHRGSSRTRVQSSVRRRGGTWQKPVDICQISVDSHGGSASPLVAVDARGNAAAAWTDVTEDQGIVQSAVRPADRGWQPPVVLSRPNHRSSASRVTFDARGEVVVVWADDTDLRVRSATRRVHGTWTAPVDIVDANTRGGGLAVSPRGRQMIRWTRKKGGAVAVASRSAGGKWRKRDDLVLDEEIRGRTIVVDDAAGLSVRCLVIRRIGVPELSARVDPLPSRYLTVRGRCVDVSGPAVSWWSRRSISRSASFAAAL